MDNDSSSVIPTPDESKEKQTPEETLSPPKEAESAVHRPKKKASKPFIMFGVLAAIFLILGISYTVRSMYFSGKICEVNGVSYKSGEEVPSSDGCNSCTCTETGEVACTLMACSDEVIPPKLDEKDSITNESETILFQKEESWGPCPPDSLCTQTTTLYSTGELILAGEKERSETLSAEEVSAVENAIDTSGIMTATCQQEDIVDYQATYTINYLGESKTIVFPGCEEELRQIENQLPDY